MGNAVTAIIVKQMPDLRPAQPWRSAFLHQDDKCPVWNKIAPVHAWVAKGKLACIG